MAHNESLEDESSDGGVLYASEPVALVHSTIPYPCTLIISTHFREACSSFFPFPSLLRIRAVPVSLRSTFLIDGAFSSRFHLATSFPAHVSWGRSTTIYPAFALLRPVQDASFTIIIIISSSHLPAYIYRLVCFVFARSLT